MAAKQVMLCRSCSRPAAFLFEFIALHVMLPILDKQAHKLLAGKSQHAQNWWEKSTSAIPHIVVFLKKGMCLLLGDVQRSEPGCWMEEKEAG